MHRKASVLVGFVLILLLVACASAFAAGGAEKPSAAGQKLPDGPFGKYDPPITITTVRMSYAAVKYAEGETAEDNIWTREFRDKLGINIKTLWTVDESQYDAKLNVSLASGDLPDAFLTRQPALMKQLWDAGKLRPLDDMLAKYGSPLMKQMLTGDKDLYQMSLVGGKLPGIAYLPSKDFWASILYTRADWLKKVGLTAPKSYDDLVNVLKAFVNNDPDGNGKADTIGLGFTKDFTAGGFADILPFFNMFHAYPQIWIKDSSGKLAYGSIQPEVKKALQAMQDLYKQGLIDQEFSTKDQAKVAQDIIGEKLGVEFGVFWNPGWPLQDLKNKNPKADWDTVVLPTAVDGKPSLNQANMAINQWGLTSSQARFPEALLLMTNLTEEYYFGESAMADYWAKIYSDPKYAEISSSPLHYPIMYFEPPTLNTDLFRWTTDAVNARDPKKFRSSEVQVEAQKIMDYLDKGDQTQWLYWKIRYGPTSTMAVARATQDKNNFLFNQFTGVPGPVQTERWSTMLDLERQVFTKIIMGQSDISEFDNFVKQWNSVGGADVTKEVNDWYAKR